MRAFNDIYTAPPPPKELADEIAQRFEKRPKPWRENQEDDIYISLSSKEFAENFAQGLQEGLKYGIENPDPVVAECIDRILKNLKED